MSMLGAAATAEKARAPVLLVPKVHWSQSPGRFYSHRRGGCASAWRAEPLQEPPPLRRSTQQSGPTRVRRTQGVRGEQAVFQPALLENRPSVQKSHPQVLTSLAACAAVSSMSVSPCLRGEPSACGRRRALFLTARQSVGLLGVQNVARKDTVRKETHCRLTHSGEDQLPE